MTEHRNAVLFRMVLPHHTCPYGIRAKSLLEQAGYEVEDHILRSRDEVDAFLDAEGVSETPQVFIGNARIGGSDEVENYLMINQS